MLAFLAAVLLGVAFGFPARWFGERLSLGAGPSTASGKGPEKTVPATGGLAASAAWWSTAIAVGALTQPALGGLALAMVPIMAIGLADLRKRLGPVPQFFAQALAAGSAVLVGGVAARYLTNPLGGLLYLDRPEVAGVAIPAALSSIVWIVFLMNAVNFLDGMDGLAVSVSGIGFLTITAVSLLPHVKEPAVALPAFLAAGATLGFLFWNFPPARLWLGTPGAWFLGFLLAVLSLQGSSKIATLAVVGAVPLLDALYVILLRLRRGASPFRGDFRHLHHRLQARGWSARAILATYVLSSILLALAAVLLPTPLKVVLLALGVGTVLTRVFVLQPIREWSFFRRYRT